MVMKDNNQNMKSLDLDSNVLGEKKCPHLESYKFGDKEGNQIFYCSIRCQKLFIAGAHDEKNNIRCAEVDSKKMRLSCLSDFRRCFSYV